MKTNKSIDGLATRADKKPAKKPQKPLKVKVEETLIVDDQKLKIEDVENTKIPEDNSNLIPEDSLKIEVLEEGETHKKSAQKSTKSKKIEVDIKDPAEDKLTSREAAIEDFLSPVSALHLEDDIKKAKKSKESIEKSKKKSQKDHKEKKKPGKIRRILTTIILVLVLAVSGIIVWAVLWGNDIIAKITGGQGNVLDLLTFTEETYDPLKTDSSGRTNILAFGTSGYNMEGDEGSGTHDGAQLTDSIMAISLNQETGDIAMVSLPRDLKASPTCTATGKINEVYWCNNQKGDNENAGATALMTEVGSILGMDFQYYAHLNWGSLISIVDILGGIKVTLDEDINDSYWTGAVYKAGVEYTLNGEQALGLARARHGTAGGDFSRGASQQKILIGIKDRIFEKQFSITDLLGLASTLGDNLRTNFSVPELKSAAHLTYDFDFESMRQISLFPDYMTTGNINGISYVIPRAGVGNYGSIQNFIAKNLSNDPRIYEEPSILVLNASEESGLASSEQSKLNKEGYNNVQVDNAPEGEYEEDITIYTINEDKPGSKTMLEDYYCLNSKPASDLPENISRDYDFVIILNPKVDSQE